MKVKSVDRISTDVIPANQMTVESHPDGSYEIKGSKFQVRANILPPEIDDDVHEIFPYSKNRVLKGSVCNRAGNIHREVLWSKKVKLVRDLFLSRHGDIAAVRLTLENQSKAPIKLKNLTPLYIHRDESLVVNDATYGKWAVMRMARHKMEVPGCFRPGVEDIDLKDAIHRSAVYVEGVDVSAKIVNQVQNKSDPVLIDSGMLIKNRNDLSGSGLFIGILGQDKHLTQISLEGHVNSMGRLGRFLVICEFDNIQVDSGEKIETHWVVFSEGKDENELMENHAESLAQYYECPAPAATAPAVWLSWYFYAHDFRQSDLEENLESLKQNPVPFDVFLIDDGWMNDFGSWKANERFPDGMKKAADMIKQAGFQPAIWTAPFLVMAHSPVLKKYPDLVAVDEKGKPVPFGYDGPLCYTVDPTSPSAPAYFDDLYSRLKNAGYLFHKLDFLRAVVSPTIRFKNPKLTRAQAYRLGLGLIRQALGKEAYIIACGGIYEGSIGIADSVRAGNDTRSYWNGPCARNESYLKFAKQNIFRHYLNRFFHVDPDGVAVRLRDKFFRGNETDYGTLALGRFSDEEAFTVVVNQFLGGGLTCLSERFCELQKSRQALYRHIIPTRFPSRRIVDIWKPGCPSTFLSSVTPISKAIKPYWILCLINWESKRHERKLTVDSLHLESASRLFAIFEFKTQEFLGVFSKNDLVNVSIPSHGTRVLYVVPWNEKDPVIIGTDMHLTGPAAELRNVKILKDQISGEIQTPWKMPLNITALFPKKGKVKVARVKVAPGDSGFLLKG